MVADKREHEASIERKLDVIMEEMSKLLDKEKDDIKKAIRDLQDYRIKKQAEEDARKGVLNWVMKNWSVIAMLLFAGYELKKMKP